MKKLAIVLCALLVLIVGGIGCGAEEETATPAPTPNDGTKMPEDVIPLTVPGFSFVEKSDHMSPIFEGEEYSVYSLFLPKASSKFSDKVENLLVQVYLFQDDASAEAAFDALAEGGTSSTEIQVIGARAILTYNEYFGETAAIQQQGRLVILSDSMPPFEVTIFDEQILKGAAIEGLKAIRP